MVVRMTRSAKLRTVGAAGAVAAIASVLTVAFLGGGAAVASPGHAARSAAGGTRAVKAAAASTAVSPTFWSGTDSNYIAIPGPAPYREPGIGGRYGGYIGMIGNWAGWQHCGGKQVWSVTNSNQARTDLVTYHSGIGVGDYWFMGGPGVDPHYDGTTTEASAWGAAQAARVISDIGTQNPKPNYPVIFMDIEIPGNAPSYTPAPDNGWNNVYTSVCSGKVRSSGIPAAVDRAVYSGFASYLITHSGYKVGVYSAPSIWASIFGTGSSATVSSTYEWTYNGDTSSLAHHPSGWCLSGTKTCADFFGGMSSSSKYAVMWQWSGGGGTYNGYGDLDQIDGSRTP